MKMHKRGFKSNIIAYAGLITYLISLIIRIPLSRMIGDAGIGMAAPALELVFLAALLFSYGISRTMTGLIRYRVKREQYKSARRVFTTAFKLSMILAVAFAFILLLGSAFLSEIIVLEALSKKAIMAAAPVVFLIALVNVFRGYFNGNGFGILVAQSQYIEKITMLIGMLIGGTLVYDYGKKAAALLLNPMVAYAYGALGVMLGMMVAELITLVYLLFVFGIYSSTWKHQLMQDTGKRIETTGEIMGMLFGNGVPIVIIVALSNLFMLVDQRLFHYCMNRTGQGEMRTSLWGAYYSKFAVLIGIGTVLVCMAVHGSISKIAMANEKEEYRLMRDKIGNAVKKLCIVAFPIAIYLAVLAQAFVKGIYKGESELPVMLLQRGTAIIVFYALAYLFGQIMLKIRMIKELFISVLVAFVLHVAMAYFLVQRALLGGEGLVYSVLLFSVVLALLCIFFVSRKINYRQEWVISIAFPALAACVSGLIAMLLNKLLLDMTGELLTILISCLVSSILYLILLMVLRVIGEAELSKIPFGNMWIILGRMIGVL